MPTDPTPRRSDDELLTLVRHKIDSIHRGRRLKVLGAGTLALFLVAGTAAFAANDGRPDHRHTLRATDRPTTTDAVDATTVPGATTSTVGGAESPSTSTAPTTRHTPRTTTTSTMRRVTPELDGHWRTEDAGGSIEVTFNPGRPKAGELATVAIHVHRNHGGASTPVVAWGDGRTSQNPSLFCDAMIVGPDGQPHYPPQDPNAPASEYTHEYRHAYRSEGVYAIEITVATDCEGAKTTSKGTISIGPGPKRANGPQEPRAYAFWHNVEGDSNSLTGHITVSGLDEDGFVSRMVLDWGDGTPPSVMTFGSCTDDGGRDWPRRSDGKDLEGTAAEFTHTYAKPGEYTYTAEVTTSGCDGGDPQRALTNPDKIPIPSNPQP